MKSNPALQYDTYATRISLHRSLSLASFPPNDCYRMISLPRDSLLKRCGKQNPPQNVQNSHNHTEAHLSHALSLTLSLSLTVSLVPLSISNMCGIVEDFPRWCKELVSRQEKFSPLLPLANRRGEGGGWRETKITFHPQLRITYFCNRRESIPRVIKEC